MTTQLYMAIAVVLGIAGLLAFPGAMGLKLRMPRLKSADFMLFIALAAIGIIGYGDKFSPTNNPPNGLNQPMMMMFNPQSPGPTVTETDVARGFSVVSVGTNEVFDFTMPTDGVRVAKWWLRGGSNDKAFVPGGIALIGGEILNALPQPFARYCPLKATSLLVAGESEFWHQQTASNSTVYTWKDAYLLRNLSLPFSMQAELFGNGDFAYRYDLSRILDVSALSNAVVGAKFGTNVFGDVTALLDRTNTVTSIYGHRLSEFDWDDDGLANEVDTEPYDNNGDFCGTCAGWYNANCSNVIVAVEGTNGVVEVSWLPDANPAAYYWLDVSVTGAVDVAGIRVTCDGPSNLGHLFVVARTNQTCHIPLLAGATYVVESTLPFCALVASSQQVVVSPSSATSATITLPLSFSFECVNPGSGSGANYALRTTPFGVGAVLDSVAGTCCTCQAAGDFFSWACGSSCACAGECGHAVSAVATWEGYSYSLSGLAMCPCYYVERAAQQQISGRSTGLEILDASGNAIDWKDPVLVGEPVQIEVSLGGEAMAVADFIALFGGRLRLKAWSVDQDGSHAIASVPVEVSSSTVVALNQNLFRVAVSASWLQSSGIVRSASDQIQAKTSIDMSAAESGESNRQDSDYFDATAAGRLHGRARGEGAGNASAAIPEGAFNLKTVRAAGTACLAATAASAESAAKQCQQQADIVYYSGHGHHDTGDLNGVAAPESVAGWWHDVDTVVFAGCAVLDIGDKANNYADFPVSHAASPGLKWLASSGAGVLLGYAYYAPLDSQGGVDIVRQWCDTRTSLGDVDAWMKANDCRSGHNACTIRRISDSEIEYQCFLKQARFFWKRSVFNIATGGAQ